jgi:hypothetical protein
MKKKRKHVQAEMSGIFDPILRFFKSLGPSRFEAFRPQEEEAPPSGALPALPGPRQLPGLPAPQRSMIPRGEQLPAPILPRAAAMFARFAPQEAPPEPAPEAPEQRSLFQVMFQPMAEEPSRPAPSAAQAFQMFAAGEPETAAMPSPRWATVPFRLPSIIPSMGPGGGWIPPTAPELTERFRSIFDLPAVFDYVRAVRQTPQFWWALQTHWREGLPALVKVLPVIYRALNLDTALLFGVPSEVFDAIEYSSRSGEEMDQRIRTELLEPLTHVLTDAFEYLKPDDLAIGFFTLYPDETGQYWLHYVEPYIPAPAPPALTWERRR